MTLFGSTSRVQKVAILGLTLGLSGIVFAATPLGLAFEENLGLRWLFAVRGASEVPPEVVVVGVGRIAAEELGLETDNSNWPRSTHAQLIDNLVDKGVALIVFDLSFSEPRAREEDSALAEAIARSRRVVLLEYMRRETLGGAIFDRMTPPIAPFSEAARAMGPFPLPIETATLNQFWAFTNLSGEVWPTLPVVALQVLALEVLDEFRSLLERAGFERLEAVPLREADVADAEELRRLMRLLGSEFRKDRLMRDRLLSFLENDEGRSLYQRQLLTALVKLYGGDDSYYLNFYGESATIPVIPYHLDLTP